MKKKNNDIMNPYFNGVNGYIDKLNSERAATNSWKTIAIISSLVSSLAVGGVIFIGAKSKFVPMVFYTDTSGAMQFGGIASDNLRITQPMIANQIAEYVISLRQIPLDMEVKTQYINKLKMMTDDSIFTNILKPMLTERYTLYRNQTVKVTIKNVIPITKSAQNGKNIYQIDWEEKINQRLIGRFRSTISFTLTNKFKDPAVALYDPLGMYITDININQEVE